MQKKKRKESERETLMKRIERDYFLGEIIVPIQSQPTESRTIIRQSNGKSGKKMAPFLRDEMA